MIEPKSLKSTRLTLCELELDHAAFVFELVNSTEWKQFIGDRNVQNVNDAKSYIRKIKDAPLTDYWVIQDQENRAMGIVTFMKRAYLDHFDIGFALLPQFSGKGFAEEATSTVLKQLKSEKTHTKILATTLPSNRSTIHLLEKLGFAFLKKIEPNKEELHVFSLSCND